MFDLGITGLEFKVGSILLLLLLTTALGIVLLRNLLTATLLLAIFSLLMAVMYLVLDAPDVAMTEAAVGAGISTVLVLAALIYTGSEEKGLAGNLLTPLIVVLITGIALLYATIGMPDFGDVTNPAQQHLKPYFIQESPEDIGIPNVVTSILASYRGFDTLGEAVVVFTAAVSVLMLLGGRDKSGKEEG